MISRPFQINVILVGTLYDRNIGATSRAMANMGAHRLILIGRKCEVTYDAQQAAASGQDGLQSRTEYLNWEEFFAQEPEGIRLAFTARDGKGRAARDFAETLEYIRTETPHGLLSDETLQMYLIFGPEDWGLSGKDLELAHYACCLPTYGNNTSLNLAQATLLALFVLRSSWGGKKARLDGQQKKPKGQTREKVFPEQTLRKWLEEMNYNLESRKTNVFTVLRRMFLHNIPTEKEIRIFETVLQQSIRRMKEGRIRNESNNITDGQTETLTKLHT